MALTDLPEWLDEQSQPPTVWFVKRLQANDTLATGSHQAGPYLPKDFLFGVFPQLKDAEAENPRVGFDVYIDSQSDYRRVQAIWYNGRLHGKTRNETRITGFGGGQSDLLDPESTGTIAVLAFRLGADPSCHVWVCRDDTECDLVEAHVGRVDPGTPVIRAEQSGGDPARFLSARKRVAGLDGMRPHGRDDSGDDANIAPPSVADLVRRSAELQVLAAQPVDTRLLRRHESFIELYRQSEHDLYTERLKTGFSDISSLLETAERIRQARQTTGDDGLALQLRQLLQEEELTEGQDFSFRPDFGSDRTPDFIFPAVTSGNGPSRATTVLLVEPAIRDRWKAAVEGTGMSVVHILTLQRGTSRAQFDEMTAAGAVLVVPARLHDTYPAEIRSQLVTLESFIADVRHLQPSRIGGGPVQL